MKKIKLYEKDQEFKKICTHADITICLKKTPKGEPNNLFGIAEASWFWKGESIPAKMYLAKFEGNEKDGVKEFNITSNSLKLTPNLEQIFSEMKQIHGEDVAKQMSPQGIVYAVKEYLGKKMAKWQEKEAYDELEKYKLEAA